MTTKTISSDFPFDLRYVEIQGSKIKYFDEGEGDPILFQNPKSDLPGLRPVTCISVPGRGTIYNQQNDWADIWQPGYSSIYF